MATLDDILTTQKNGVVAINGLRQILQTFLTALTPVSGAALKVGYIAVTAVYDVLVTDCVVDATSGTFDVNLFTAIGTKGQIVIVKNSGAGTVTVVPFGAQTIDGGASVVLAASDATRLCSTGANWIVL
jgi:hypothetical protein